MNIAVDDVNVSTWNKDSVVTVPNYTNKHQLFDTECVTYGDTEKACKVESANDIMSSLR